jgi:hypothetical protein
MVSTESEKAMELDTAIRFRGQYFFSKSATKDIDLEAFCGVLVQSAKAHLRRPLPKAKSCERCGFAQERFSAVLPVSTAAR